MHKSPDCLEKMRICVSGSSFFGLQDVKGSAAVHAAPALGEHDVEDGRGTVIKRPDLERLLVLEGKVIQKGSAFTQGACRPAAFEIRKCPQESARRKHCRQQIGCNTSHFRGD